jgi:type VI secretion system protein ImpM
MACGLFGKMPSKRDFIAYNMERPFLDTWEQWLQAGVASSREIMGEAWQNAFLAAPIWRFWLGQKIAGLTTAGALMPSVDKVGRYFPLSLCAPAPAGFRIAPPPDTALDDWHDNAERFLLELLEDELPEDPARLIGGMHMPAMLQDARLGSLHSAFLNETPADGDIGRIFAALVSEDSAATHGERTYWWTLGGPNHPPKVMVMTGLPEPPDFALLLGAQRPMSIAS